MRNLNDFDCYFEMNTLSFTVEFEDIIIDFKLA